MGDTPKSPEKQVEPPPGLLGSHLARLFLAASQCPAYLGSKPADWFGARTWPVSGDLQVTSRELWFQWEAEQ